MYIKDVDGNLRRIEVNPDGAIVATTMIRQRSITDALDDLLENKLGFEQIDEYGRCMSCGRKDVELVIKYGLTLERKICGSCCTKALDLVLGVGEIDEESERLLYGEK